jgi:hypothetical protein
MGQRIRIGIEEIEGGTELNNARRAQAIWEALPVTSRANLWGEGICFSVPAGFELEAGQGLVSVGNPGYCLRAAYFASSSALFP